MRILRSRRRLHLAAPVFVLLAWSLPAAGQVLGPEFQVNSYTTHDQSLAQLAADEAGRFVAVWGSRRQDGSNGGVYAQRFDPDGLPLGGEFRVNTFTPAYQTVPDVAVDGAGNFVVVWESDLQDGSGRGVFGQRFDSTANPIGGEFQVNSATTDDQVRAALAVRSNGEFVVVWESWVSGASNSDVEGQRYDSAGNPVGAEFRVNSFTPGPQSNAEVAMDDAGDFVVVWTSRLQDGDSYGIFGQRFDAGGDPAGPEFQVNTYTTGMQSWPSVAAAHAGDFVVVWDSFRQDGSDFGTFGQRFDAAGVPVGSEFLINSYTTNEQTAPVVALSETGDFVVAWSSYRQDGSLWGVFGQQFDADGDPVGSPFQVNSHTPDEQFFPAVVAQSAHDFVVAWADYGGLDGSGQGVFARQVTLAMFRNGFEADHVCDWSLEVGGAEMLPPRCP